MKRTVQVVYMVDNYVHDMDEQGVEYFGRYISAWNYALTMHDGHPENNPKIYELVDCSEQQDWSLYTVRQVIEVTQHDVQSSL